MQLQALQELVHKTRDTRRKQTLPKYSPAERDTLIKKYHPDHRENAYRPIKFGPNAGDQTVRELAALLEGDSPVSAELDLTPTYSSDVLVVGGGGAGCAAADRKSTRLNSSHLVISYAVFCLKKKKNTK